jgi:thioredoxin reductase
VEYQCEVEGVLTPEEFTALGRSPTQFPESATSHLETGSGVTSCPADTYAWPLYVSLTNGTVFGCDLVVSATGVVPNAEEIMVEEGRLAIAGDGGVVVDRQMRTNLPRVYAAGDICTTHWDNHSNLWFQVCRYVSYADPLPTPFPLSFQVQPAY